MAYVLFEVEQLHNACCVREYQHKVHLLIEQSLTPEDDDELPKAKKPEKDAGEHYALLSVLVLLVLLGVACRDRCSDMICSRLENDGDSDHLEYESNELHLLHNARIFLHFEFNFVIWLFQS